VSTPLHPKSHAVAKATAAMKLIMMIPPRNHAVKEAQMMKMVVDAAQKQTNNVVFKTMTAQQGAALLPTASVSQ